jgi:hypothetical protein
MEHKNICHADKKLPSFEPLPSEPSGQEKNIDMHNPSGPPRTKLEYQDKYLSRPG